MPASEMPASVLRFIWSKNPAGHLKLLAMVLLLVSFNYVSLELPRLIVNGVTDAVSGQGKTDLRLLELDVALPDELGGAVLWHTDGWPVDALGMLGGLCAMLLMLQLAQQQVSSVIDLNRLRVGEELARNLRAQVHDLMLRLRPEAPMKPRATELARLLRGEISGLGRFARSAFAQCFLSAGLIFSSVLLIFMQTTLLGIAALVILALNGLLLAWLRGDNAHRTEHLHASGRRFARDMSGTIDRLPMIHAFATSHAERHDMAVRLEGLYEASLDLKRKSFIEKAMSALLSDIPTLVFYFAGGWLALSRTIDIGQLVAIVAAYQQIPEPLKALVDWDEERLEAQLQYNFLVREIDIAESWAPDYQDKPAPPADRFDGSIRARDLQVSDGLGRRLLDSVSLDLEGGRAIGLSGPESGGKHVFAQVLGRQVTRYDGVVHVGGYDLEQAPEALQGCRSAYAGSDTLLLDATLRANMTAGLLRRRPEAPAEGWLDRAGAGARTDEELDARILEALALAGLAEPVLRLGLESKLDPTRTPLFCARIVSLRANVAALVAARESAGGRGGHLVEPLDESRFNRWMSIGENVLFGAPVDGSFNFVATASHPEISAALQAEGLPERLLTLGRAVAVALKQIADASNNIELIDTKGLVRRSEFAEVMRLAEADEDDDTPQTQALLWEIAARYCEPNHRLGLIDEALERQILAARGRVEQIEDLGAMVARYQRRRYCPVLSVRDNLLFGRIAADQAGARAAVDGLLRAALAELELDDDIERLALDLPLGDGGFALVPSERARLALARCLLVRPDLLIIDDVLRPLSGPERRTIIANIIAARAGKTTVVVAETGDPHDIFETMLLFEHGQLSRIDHVEPPSSTRRMEATA
ncbi:MAG TPA: ABC transporter transmembrane domain-containing protein [Xanthobacteraceae bacterium]|nr:ABC transporter transmembrane domain-containing protein [Xanthobacteraceae bacterium]